MVLTSREDDLMRDPVLFFLTLAMLDDAVKGVDSIEQFYDVRPRPGCDKFMFEWNDKVLDQPVFRLINRHKGVTQDAWHCDQMFSQLQNVVECAGYQRGDITGHTIRRGFANAIESK